jgi:hypothetical protein
MTPEFRRELAVMMRDLASSAIDGSRIIEALQSNEPLIKGSPDLESAWHLVYHFIADADVRGRDPDYDQARRKALIEQANLIDAVG